MLACSFGHGKDSVAKQLGRPVQHSKKKDCPVYVRFYCRGSKESREFCVLTSFREDHNHMLNEAIHSQETHKIRDPDEFDFVSEALKMNVTAAQVKNRVRDKFGKPGISINHVRYMMSRLKSSDSEIEDLSIYLEQVVEEGGSVRSMLDNKHETVRVLTIQTKEMRKAYSSISPNIVFVDTTFNFNNEGYKMSSFAYLNPVTNKGEIAHLFFLADEGAEALEFSFNSFKTANTHVPGYFMVDKDFGELSSLSTIFPNSTFLLCQFHVMKYLKTLISTAQEIDGGANVDYERKADIMNSFRALVYAVTEDDAEVKLVVFQNKMDGLKVRVGNGEKAYYANLREYFQRNWESCSDKWLTCKRRNIPGLEDENTNNRLERLWRTMKDHLRGVHKGPVSINKAVGILVTFAEKKILERYTYQMRHSMKIAHRDPIIAEEYKQASLELNDRGMMKLKQSVDLLMNKEDMLVVTDDDGQQKGVQEVFRRERNLCSDPAMEGGRNHIKTYKTNENGCNCSWSYRSGAPCRHILFFRRAHGLPLFDINLFSARFHKMRCYDLDNECKETVREDDMNNNISSDEIVEDLLDVKPKVLNRGEKYRLVSPLIEQLQEAMVRSGTHKVESYANEMQAVLDNVRSGKSLLSNNSSETILGDKIKIPDTVKENSEGINNVFGDEMSISNNNDQGQKKGVFDLSWHSGFKGAGRVGRPRESKVKFVKRKTLPRKQETASSSEKHRGPENEILCTLSENPEKVRQYAIFTKDLTCLRPRSFITNEIVDFKFKQIQPKGPSGQPVWLMSSYHAQLLKYWEKTPSLRIDVEAAKLFAVGGCEIVFMAFCEASHFFGIVGVCGAKPAIFILESIGGYRQPEGVPILLAFMHEMQQLRKIPKSKIEIYTPTVPKQPTGSNDCGIFMIENAMKVVENHNEFIRRATANQLTDWYSPSALSNRRVEITKQLIDLAQEQRRVGQILQHLPQLDLQVKLLKRISKDSGKTYYFT